MADDPDDVSVCVRERESEKTEGEVDTHLQIVLQKQNQKNKTENILQTLFLSIYEKFVQYKRNYLKHLFVASVYLYKSFEVLIS